jgi:hypothetical protein
LGQFDEPRFFLSKRITIRQVGRGFTSRDEDMHALERGAE